MEVSFLYRRECVEYPKPWVRTSKGKSFQPCTCILCTAKVLLLSMHFMLLWSICMYFPGYGLKLLCRLFRIFGHVWASDGHGSYFSDGMNRRDVIAGAGSSCQGTTAWETQTIVSSTMIAIHGIYLFPLSSASCAFSATIARAYCDMMWVLHFDFGRCRRYLSSQGLLVRADVQCPP